MLFLFCYQTHFFLIHKNFDLVGHIMYNFGYPITRNQYITQVKWWFREKEESTQGLEILDD